MTLTQEILWWCVVVVGLVGSSLYSGLETGTYSLNRVRLQLLAHEGKASAKRLLTLLQRPSILLGTLLIGNNLTNYMGTAGLTVLLEARGMTDLQIVLLNVAIITPLLFVFGETLPKDLFHAHADRLVYPLSPLLAVSRRVFAWSGLLSVVNGFSHAVMRIAGMKTQAFPFHPRRQVGVLVRESVGYGVLSDEQSAIVERVLDLGARDVSQEMTPWSRVLTLPGDAGPELLWELADQTSTSRFPVVDRRGGVIGVVSLYHALMHPRERCPSIIDLARPPLRFDHRTPSRDALARLQQADIPMAIVTDRGRPVGLVTVKDLVEPITGELASW